MNTFLQCAISDFLITPCNLYLWCKLLKKKIDFKSPETYIIFALMYITTLLNYVYNNQFVKILTITVLMAIFIKFLFNEKANTSILTAITAQMLYIFSEFIFAFGLLILKVNPEDFVTLYFGTILSNFIICVIVVMFVNFKFVTKLYNLLLRITDKIKVNTLIVLSLIVMIASNILVMCLYYDLSFIKIMIFNIFFMVVCLIIVVYSLYNKNRYNKVFDKYNTTLNSLKEYENILDRYRVSNHENKNQLLTIRNMVPKNNKKVVNYIDTLVENKLKDNDLAMAEAAKIPAGGLRGLIYSKMLLMKDLKIDYKLDISKEIKTVDFIKKIDDSTMLDICKIIGVYLDNAIQAVENLDEKIVNIEIYLENKELVICIANNYKGSIDIEKIEEKGFTSKGKNHGYGLVLAKTLIDSNKLLSNEKSISKTIFTQKLKIKM